MPQSIEREATWVAMEPALSVLMSAVLGGSREAFLTLLPCPQQNPWGEFAYLTAQGECSVRFQIFQEKPPNRAQRAVGVARMLIACREIIQAAPGMEFFDFTADIGGPAFEPRALEQPAGGRTESRTYELFEPYRAEPDGFVTVRINQKK